MNPMIAACVAATLAVPLAVPASAEPPAAASASITPARTALAKELIGYTQPRELMIEAILHGWQIGVAQQDRSEIDKLDSIQPGLSALLTERGKSEIVAVASERVPQLHDRLAALFAANCNEDELKELISFYSSPAGRKLVRSVTMAASGGEEAFEDEQLTAAEATQANREAAKEAVKTLDGDEWIAATKFGLSPAGRTVKKLSPQVQAISAAWMTELMAEYGKRIDPIIEEMVGQAMDEADKKAGSD